MKVGLFVFALLALFAFVEGDETTKTRARWEKIESAMKKIAGNFEDVEMVASTLMKLNARQLLLTERFNNCTSAACTYWTRHSLVRNRREIKWLNRMSRCAAIGDEDAQKACADNVLLKFRRGTEPGEAGRLARFEDKWMKSYTDLKKLGFLVRSGNAEAAQKAIDAELKRLSKAGDVLMLTKAACSDNEACLAGEAKEEKRLRREEHFVRAVGRCLRRSDHSARSRCVRRTIRRMVSRTRPGVLSKNSLLPRRERLRREKEDVQMQILQSNLKDCDQDDSTCVSKAEAEIVALTTSTKIRRKEWKNHRALVRQRKREARRRMRAMKKALEEAKRAKRAKRASTTTSVASTTISSSTTTKARTTQAPTRKPFSARKFKKRLAALKRSLKSCKSKKCRAHVTRRIRRLLNRRIAIIRASWRSCTSGECRRRHRRELGRLLRQLRRNTRKRVRGLRKRLQKCTSKSCKKRAKRALKKAYGRYRRALERSLDDLNRKITRCATDDCKERVRLAIANVTEKLRRSYARLERFLRKRVAVLSKKLGKCSRGSCKRRYKRRLRKVFRVIRRHLHRRINYLQRRLTQCASNECKEVVQAKLVKLMKYLEVSKQKSKKRRERKRTCSSKGLLALRARIRLCKKDRACKKPLVRRLSRCLLKRRSCSKDGRRALRRRIRRCKTSHCRRRYKRRLRRCRSGVPSQKMIVFPAGPVLGVDVNNAFNKRNVKLEKRASRCRSGRCIARVARQIRKLYVTEIKRIKASADKSPSVRVELNDLRTRMRLAKQATREARRRRREAKRALRRLQKEERRVRKEAVRQRRAAARALRKARREARRLLKQARRGRTLDGRAVRMIHSAKRAQLAPKNCLDGLKTGAYRKRRNALRRRIAKCTTVSCRNKHRKRLLSVHRKQLKRLLRHRDMCTKKKNLRPIRRAIRHVRAAIHHLRNVFRRQKLAAARKRLLVCGADNKCVKKVTGQIQVLSREMDLVEEVYDQLKVELNQCGAGLKGRACRQKVFEKFRRHLHAKEKALLREQQNIARARYGRTVLACSHNMLGNAAALESCVTKARQAFSERVKVLRLRGLRTDLRAAIRQCGVAPVPALCEKLAREEFAKLQLIASQDAENAAQALFKQMIPKA